MFAASGIAMGFAVADGDMKNANAGEVFLLNLPIVGTFFMAANAVKDANAAWDRRNSGPMYSYKNTRINVKCDCICDQTDCFQDIDSRDYTLVCKHPNQGLNSKTGSECLNIQMGTFLPRVTAPVNQAQGLLNQINTQYKAAVKAANDAIQLATQSSGQVTAKVKEMGITTTKPGAEAKISKTRHILAEYLHRANWNKKGLDQRLKLANLAFKAISEIRTHAQTAFNDQVRPEDIYAMNHGEFESGERSLQLLLKLKGEMDKILNIHKVFHVKIKEATAQFSKDAKDLVEFKKASLGLNQAISTSEVDSCKLPDTQDKILYTKTGAQMHSIPIQKAFENAVKTVFGTGAPQVLSMLRNCQAKNAQAAAKKDKAVFEKVAKAKQVVKWNQPDISEKDASLLARNRIFGAQANRFPG
jgi:hypothetical protein